jgi:hypothetical protein
MGWDVLAEGGGGQKIGKSADVVYGQSLYVITPKDVILNLKLAYKRNMLQILDVNNYLQSQFHCSINVPFVSRLWQIPMKK